MPAHTHKETITNFLVDLDGTLVYTERANKEAYLRAFAQCNIAFDPKLFQSCFGLRFDAMIEKLAPHIGKEQREAVKVAKQALYPLCFEYLEVNKPLIYFLQSMQERSRIALVTTAREANARAVLTHIGITELFTTFVFGECVKKGEPDPECYLRALQLLGATPESALAFEDSEVGVAVAQAAGVSVIRVA